MSICSKDKEYKKETMSDRGKIEAYIDYLK